MNRPLRRHVTLVMSLILMIFSICQAQARAHLPAQPSRHDHHVSLAMHHEAAAPQAADCHDNCLQLTAHPDAGQTAQLPDVSPVLLAWLPPEPARDAVAARALAYQSPSASVADPPPLIRFQRFLN